MRVSNLEPSENQARFRKVLRSLENSKQQCFSVLFLNSLLLVLLFLAGILISIVTHTSRYTRCYFVCWHPSVSGANGISAMF